MQFIAVDWSGNARDARKHIWIAVVRDGELVFLENGRDREEVGKFLEGWALQADRTVVGLDFAFSMPEWFLRHKNLGSATELWELAASEGEKWLAESPPPFWGRKGTHPPETHLRWRADEIAIPATAGISPKSVFQIAGAGAVGTGTVRGLPLLAILGRAGFSIWPFDPPSSRTVIEIYPRLLTGPVKKSDQSHRVAFLDSDRWKMSEAFRTLAASTEDAFDAAVSAFVMAENEHRLAELGQTADPTTRLEGKIWYPANLPVHVWSVPKPVTPPGRLTLEVLGEHESPGLRQPPPNPADGSDGGSDRLRIVTWNMSHWQQRQAAERAWSFLLNDLAPDVALVQEAVPLVRNEFTLWREIPGKGNWGTGIVTRGLPIREFELETISHPGAMIVGEVTLPGGRELTAISIYGALEKPLRAKAAKPESYATTSMQRMLSDLTFLLDGVYGRRPIVMGGDTNVSTQLPPPWTAHHQAVIDRIAAFGLIDCLALSHDGHVQTQRHPRSKVAWQNDYLYVSKDLRSKIRSCEPIATETAWSLSQHCPVLLELHI